MDIKKEERQTEIHIDRNADLTEKKIRKTNRQTWNAKGKERKRFKNNLRKADWETYKSYWFHWEAQRQSTTVENRQREKEKRVKVQNGCKDKSKDELRVINRNIDSGERKTEKIDKLRKWCQD